MLCALFSADFRAAMNTLIRNVTAADVVDGVIKRAAGKKKIVLVKPV